MGYSYSYPISHFAFRIAPQTPENQKESCQDLYWAKHLTGCYNRQVQRPIEPLNFGLRPVNLEPIPLGSSDLGILAAKRATTKKRVRVWEGGREGGT